MRRGAPTASLRSLLGTLVVWPLRETGDYGRLDLRILPFVGAEVGRQAGVGEVEGPHGRQASAECPMDLDDSEIVEYFERFDCLGFGDGKPGGHGS